MAEALGKEHTCGRGPLRGLWWRVGPKLVFDQMAASVPEIVDTSGICFTIPTNFKRTYVRACARACVRACARVCVKYTFSVVSPRHYRRLSLLVSRSFQQFVQYHSIVWLHTDWITDNGHWINCVEIQYESFMREKFNFINPVRSNCGTFQAMYCLPSSWVQTIFYLYEVKWVIEIAFS
jgi:hypothetical protein